MNLLVFFALPLATILLAIVLEKILKCPILVAITFFSIYLIALFILFAIGVITNLANGLIAVIIYTIIAFITAWIVRLIKFIIERLLNCNDNDRRNIERTRRCCCCCNNNDDDCREDNNDLLRISCRCNNGNSQNLLTINSNCLGNEEDNRNNGNNCECSNNNDVAVPNNRCCSYWKCNPKSI